MVCTSYPPITMQRFTCNLSGCRFERAIFFDRPMHYATTTFTFVGETVFCCKICSIFFERKRDFRYLAEAICITQSLLKINDILFVYQSLIFVCICLWVGAIASSLHCLTAVSNYPLIPPGSKTYGNQTWKIWTGITYCT